MASLVRWIGRSDVIAIFESAPRSQVQAVGPQRPSRRAPELALSESKRSPGQGSARGVGVARALEAEEVDRDGMDNAPGTLRPFHRGVSPQGRGLQKPAILHRTSSFAVRSELGRLVVAAISATKPRRRPSIVIDGVGSIAPDILHQTCRPTRLKAL